MTAMHLDQMTLDGCTIYHDGDVFFGAHSAFTLMFEQVVTCVCGWVGACLRVCV